MNQDSPLGLWLSCIKTYRLIQAELSSRLKHSHDISLPQFQLLSQLASGEAKRMGDLADALLMTNGNITGLAGRLHKLGWVEFLHDPKDKRVHKLSLSRSGKDRFNAILKDYEAWVDDLFSQIKASDYQEFRDLIRNIRPKSHEN